MTTPADITRRILDNQTARYERSTATIVSKLRSLADLIVVVSGDDANSYVRRTARIQSELLWGLANMGLDRLTELAASIDELTAQTAVLDPCYQPSGFQAPEVIATELAACQARHPARPCTQPSPVTTGHPGDCRCNACLARRARQEEADTAHPKGAITQTEVNGWVGGIFGA